MLTTLSSIGQRLEVAWSRRFRNLVEGEGQTFYWMDVSRALHCQDLGEEEVWVASDDYRLALADPLKDVAGGIVEYFNREHWEDIRRFCSVYAGLEDADVEEASMTWVDRLGIDMQVLLRDSQKIQEVRVPFMREVTDDRDARSVLTMMAQLAWEKERQYLPNSAQLLGARM
eukprot:SM000050S17010  [mRNA]  locus=s50:324007:325418:- [translate_table: standard]